MAQSLFLVPGTPASSSRAASAMSDDSSLPASTSSNASKPIWVFFRNAEGNETASYSVKRSSGRQSYKIMHYCLLCEQHKAPSIWCSPFAQNAKRHIESKHFAEWQRWISSNKAMSNAPPLFGQNTLDGFISVGHSQLSEQVALRNAYDRKRHIQAMIALCSRRRLALSATDWPELRELMLSANPAISNLIKLSRRTLVRLLVKNHRQYRSHLQSGLQNARSKIHISTDMWTSPARRGHLAICAQWLDYDYNLRKALLGLSHVEGSHSGEAQATQIMSTLDDYGIATRFGYHTGDNATSNDTLMKHLTDQLESKYLVCLMIPIVDLY